jgi:hypothetical protein
MKFVFLEGLQILKYVRNLTSTRKQKQKYKITKKRSIKSKTSKKQKKITRKITETIKTIGLNKIFDI